MINRVSTSDIHQKTVSDILKIQTDLANIQNKISSGRKADNFFDMGGDINKIADVENSIKSTDKFVEGNEIALTRLKIMDISVSRIQEIAASFASELVVKRSAVGENFDISVTAREFLTQIENELNLETNGRYLFSGSKTNQPPTSNLDISSNLINEQVTANYYQGDTVDPSIKASEQLTVNYGIRADNIGFQNIIGALHQGIVGQQTESDDDLAKAVDFVNQAVSELAQVRSQINSDIITLEEENQQHNRVNTQLKDVLSNFVSTDVVEASIEAAFNEALLTATMQTFARISNLNLSRFLN